MIYALIMIRYVALGKSASITGQTLVNGCWRQLSDRITTIVSFCKHCGDFA
jgi:hypothetical protein